MQSSSRRAPSKGWQKLANQRPWHTGVMDAREPQAREHEPDDLDLKILDVLREGPRSAYRLARMLSRAGESADTEAIRSRLVALASRGCVAGTPFGPQDEAETPTADPWRITREGRIFVEPEEGVAKAPYDRDLGGEEQGGRDAGFWVLIAIAVVTAICAAYALLIATGVL